MHILIVGNSGTGKSQCAMALAREAADAGHKVIVHDPTRQTEWPSTATKYADSELFLEDAPNMRNAYVFIDEGADLWAVDEIEANKLIYRGRHRGLLFIIIAQRATMIRPNGRNMCRTVYSFRQNFDSAKTLAQEFNPALIDTTDLEDCDGIHVDGLQARPIRLDFTSGQAEISDRSMIDADTIQADN